jgi:hypothetical protein
VRNVDEPTFATDPSALMMTVFGADDSIGKRAQEFIEKSCAKRLAHQQKSPIWKFDRPNGFGFLSQ